MNNNKPEGSIGMKILTVNLPIHYINRIEMLIKNGLYPSRSEAIRNAIREFLLVEFKMIERMNDTIEKERKNREEEDANWLKENGISILRRLE